MRVISMCFILASIIIGCSVNEGDSKSIDHTKKVKTGESSDTSSNKQYSDFINLNKIEQIIVGVWKPNTIYTATAGFRLFFSDHSFFSSECGPYPEIEKNYIGCCGEWKLVGNLLYIKVGVVLIGEKLLYKSSKFGATRYSAESVKYYYDTKNSDWSLVGYLDDHVGLLKGDYIPANGLIENIYNKVEDIQTDEAAINFEKYDAANSYIGQVMLDKLVRLSKQKIGSTDMQRLQKIIEMTGYDPYL